MGKRFKVLHIITGLGRGGAEAMLLKLLAATDREQFELLVVSLSDAGVYGVEIEKLGIPVYCLNIRGGVPGLHHWLRLRALTKGLRPDIIHGWMYHAAFAGFSVAGSAPLIIAIRQVLSDMAQEKLFTRLVIRALGHISGRAASITYNSYESWKTHSELGYSEAVSKVIPNGFECDKFFPDKVGGAQLRRELGLSDKAFVVGHLARYHPVKDHKTLLAGFSAFSRSHRDAMLVMAGDGVTWENAALVHEIKVNGLDSKCLLLGPREDVPQLLNSFDVFLNTSRSEAFANVIGEAMACGVPCIVTDVGDSAFIIDDFGIAVPSGNPDALADAIQKLAIMPGDELKAIGEHARQRVLDHFSISKVAEAYQSLYQSLLV